MLDKCSIIAKYVALDNLERVNRTSKQVIPKVSFYSKYTKRLLDLAISVPIFIFLIPIYVILGTATYFDVGTPIFFKQKRTGKDGKHFYLIKFRNMTNKKDASGILLPPNQRVTRFGMFVRKYSLDELLNFWSVIKGDMSLIGPRPLPAIFDERISIRHKYRTAVRPGLECPSIDGDNKIRLYQEQFENDIWYVENISFVTDVKLVFALFRMVFNFKERSDHASVGGGDLVGYDENGRAFSMRHIPPKYEEIYNRLCSEKVEV